MFTSTPTMPGSQLMRFGTWLVMKERPFPIVCLHYAASLRGTRQHWFRQRSRLISMVDTLGLPTVFFTHSAADHHWLELAHLLSSDDPDTSSSRTVAVINNPAICDWFFSHRIQKFVEAFYVGALHTIHQPGMMDSSTATVPFSCLHCVLTSTCSTLSPASDSWSTAPSTLPSVSHTPNHSKTSSLALLRTSRMTTLHPSGQCRSSSSIVLETETTQLRKPAICFCRYRRSAHPGTSLCSAWMDPMLWRIT